MNTSSGLAEPTVTRWLSEYDQYLQSVKGAAPATRYKYLYFAKLFISAHFNNSTTLDWSSLSASAITAFVENVAQGRKGFGRKAPAVSIRAMLRYLAMCGYVRPGLEAAIPIPRVYKHAALPTHLSDHQIAMVLSACTGNAATGIRNRAILLLLSRLGLRAKEVISLQLRDIGWTDGHLIIRAGKTHRERMLPLPHDVGVALIEYLKEGRPSSTHSALFLGSSPPYDPLLTATAISHIAKRALRKVDIEMQGISSHVFRHTSASRMVQKGASFKEVADILGHQSLQTTTIYAKLNLPALSEIALPWPGGEA